MPHLLIMSSNCLGHDVAPEVPFTLLALRQIVSPVSADHPAMHACMCTALDVSRSGC